MANIICITCPKGCHLTVDEETLEVRGNSCERGVEYGRNELTHPVRMITSTVKLSGGRLRRLPVKTSQPIPKGMMEEVVRALDDVTVTSPVRVGDVVIENVCGTGADIIATREL
ncbi:MAG: DUF1667 domain-containing protein [Ruminococcaceae bacterium]|nr:DUF1667 domain-containing protein [Oscillospiraceae bacterium]